MDEAALYELCANGGEEGNEEGSGSEDKSGIDGAIPVERLQELRDHCGGGEEAETEDKVILKTFTL